jgi:hypothetical protein
MAGDLRLARNRMLVYVVLRFQQRLGFGDGCVELQPVVAQGWSDALRRNAGGYEPVFDCPPSLIAVQMSEFEWQYGLEIFMRVLSERTLVRMSPQSSLGSNAVHICWTLGETLRTDTSLRFLDLTVSKQFERVSPSSSPMLIS